MVLSCPQRKPHPRVCGNRSTSDNPLVTATGTTRISVHQKRRAVLGLPHLTPQGRTVTSGITEMQRESSVIFRNKHFKKTTKNLLLCRRAVAEHTRHICQDQTASTLTQVIHTSISPRRPNYITFFSCAAAGKASTIYFSLGNSQARIATPPGAQGPNGHQVQQVFG